MPYAPVKHFMHLVETFPGLNSSKQGIKYPTQKHNTVSQVRLKPATPQTLYYH